MIMTGGAPLATEPCSTATKLSAAVTTKVASTADHTCSPAMTPIVRTTRPATTVPPMARVWSRRVPPKSAIATVTRTPKAAMSAAGVSGSHQRPRIMAMGTPIAARMPRWSAMCAGSWTLSFTLGP